MMPILQAQESKRRAEEGLYGLAVIYGLKDLTSRLWAKWTEQEMPTGVRQEEEQSSGSAEADRNAFVNMMNGSGLARR